MSAEKPSIRRREFLSHGAAAISLLSILGQWPTEAFGQALPTKPLDPALPLAQALGYTHEATKVDTTKYPKRQGSEGAKQFCDNCALYTQGGVKLAGQEGEWGKCTMFADGLVNAKGWCNSWVLKPA